MGGLGQRHRPEGQSQPVVGAEGEGVGRPAPAGTLDLDEVRAYRWRQRGAVGELADRAVGGNPMHGLLDDEVAFRPSKFTTSGARSFQTLWRLLHTCRLHRAPYRAEDPNA